MRVKVLVVSDRNVCLYTKVGMYYLKKDVPCEVEFLNECQLEAFVSSGVIKKVEKDKKEANYKKEVSDRKEAKESNVIRKEANSNEGIRLSEGSNVVGDNGSVISSSIVSGVVGDSEKKEVEKKEAEKKRVRKRLGIKVGDVVKYRVGDSLISGVVEKVATKYIYVRNESGVVGKVYYFDLVK